VEELHLDGRLAHIRDAFVFCCYTGLRFSDFCLLREEFLKVEDGCTWIKMNMKKTGTEVAIPVGLLFEGKGVEILKRYPSVEAFARIGSNSKVNQSLKELQKSAHINTHMTFHLSRHTCATLLCYQGVPITTIQKILGHTRLATTLIYQEVMTETMVKDLKEARHL
jgi:integrase